MKRKCRHILVAIAAAVITAGCAGDDVPTTAPPQEDHSLAISPVERRFTPLAEGDWWRYDATFRLEFIPLNAGASATAEIFQGTIEREIIGTEERFEREYVLQESMFYAEARPDTIFEWHRYRQDGAGLYLAKVPAGWPPDFEPPQSITMSSTRRSLPIPDWSRIVTAIDRPLPPYIRRALGAHLRRLHEINRLVAPEMGPYRATQDDGILPNEIQRLAYPVLTGSEWMVREAPFTVRAIVEALEVVDLPMGPTPGYRVRIDNELMGPEDTVLQWHSRCGWLGFFSHLETFAMDPLTGETFLILTEQTEWLADLDLSEGSCRRPD